MVSEINLFDFTAIEGVPVDDLTESTGESSYAQTLTLLQLDGELSPLLCLLLKRAATEIGESGGRARFEELLKRAIHSLSFDQTIENYLLQKISKHDYQTILNLIRFTAKAYKADPDRALQGQLNVVTRNPKELEKRLFKFELDEAFQCIAPFIDNLEQGFPLMSFDDLRSFLNEGNSAGFKRELLRLLKQIVEESPHDLFQKFHFFQLEMQLESTDKTVFLFLSRLLKGENFFRTLAAKVKEFTENVEDQTEAERVHTFAKAYLGDRANVWATSEMKYAEMAGFVNRNFRRLGEKWEANHLFCRCQAKTPDEEAYSHAELRRRSICTLSCSLGGGHNTAQEGLRQYASDSGMHVYPADGLNDVLGTLDFAKNILKHFGIDATYADAFNTLKANNCFAILDFFYALFHTEEEDPKTREAKLQLMMRHLLIQSPDIVGSVYGLSSSIIAEACEHLGLPLLNCTTDYDSNPSDMPFPTTNPHAKFTIWKDDEQVREALEGRIRPDQRALVTPLVRQSFLKPPEDMAALRERWDVASDETVIVLSFSSVGTSSSVPDIIAKTFSSDDRIRVFVLTGTNAKEKERLESALGKAGPRFTILGKIPEEKVCELMDLAAYPDKEKMAGCFVGRLGGSTAAEVKKRGLRVICDMSYNRGDWEEINAIEWCETKGMGKIIYDKNDLKNVLKTLLKDHVNEEKRAIASAGDPQRDHIDLLADLVAAAENDPSIASRRGQVTCSERNVSMDMTRFDAFRILPSDLSRIEAGAYVGYNESSNQFYALKKSSRAGEKQVAAKLSDLLEKCERGAMEVMGLEEHIRTLATHFLERMRVKYLDQINEGFKANRSHSFMMNLAKIDRYTVASMLRGSDLTLVHEIRDSYRTKMAREQLDFFLQEPTHRGKKKKSGECVIEEKIQGALFFGRHPHLYDFVIQNRLDKQLGTFDHTFGFDPENSMLIIRTEEGEKGIDEVAATHTSKRRRLYRDDKRVFYHYDRGLAFGDPEHFDNIPIFKVNENRKHADYRVVIKTFIDFNGFDGEKHTWIVLKNPEGEVRSISLFSREGEEVGYLNLGAGTPGDFHAGDRWEYARMEQRTVSTKHLITEKQHDAIIERLESLQKDVKNRNFNTINHNCTTVVHETLKDVIDMDMPVRSSVLEIYGRLNLADFFLIKYIPPIRLVAVIACYILSVIRNIGLFLMGGHFWGEERGRYIYDSFWDLFNPWSAMPHHPKTVRKWQERVKAAQADLLEEIKAEYAHKMDGKTKEERNGLRKELDQKIYKIRTTVPEKLANREKPSFFWKILDLFWPCVEPEHSWLTPP